jgi:hypothetical protein
MSSSLHLLGIHIGFLMWALVGFYSVHSMTSELISSNIVWCLLHVGIVHCKQHSPVGEITWTENWAHIKENILYSPEENFLWVWHLGWNSNRKKQRNCESILGRGSKGWIAAERSLGIFPCSTGSSDEWPGWAKTWKLEKAGVRSGIGKWSDLARVYILNSTNS